MCIDCGCRIILVNGAVDGVVEIAEDGMVEAALQIAGAQIVGFRADTIVKKFSDHELKETEWLKRDLPKDPQ